MWKYLLVILTFLDASVLAQELEFQYSNPDDIPDSIAIPIMKRLDWEIFNYRMRVNPEFSEKDYTRSKEGGDSIRTRRWDTRSVFLEKQGIPTYVGPLLFEIKHLIASNGFIHPNYYVLEKKENTVADLNLEGKTIRKPVNLYDDYYPDGEKYLVYYNHQLPRTRPLMISGKVLWEPISTMWFTGDKTSTGSRLALLRRTFMYHTNSRVYPLQTESNIKEDSDFFFFEVEKSSLSRKSLIAKVPNNNRFEGIELIYYTNFDPNQNATGVFEVKYILRSEPQTYKETLPVYRQLSDEEFKNLQRMSFFRFMDFTPMEKETELDSGLKPAKKKKGKP